MAEILLYGVIGDPNDKLDARTVTQDVRAASGPLSVRINSPGGYVMEGLAIVQSLRDYPGKVTIYVDGLAASMASVIAMIGAEIIMAESSLMMIHKPWDCAIGNADDMRRDASKLDKIEAQLIGIYAKRTGLSESRLAAMLAAETWLTASEAHELGFVTAIAAPLQIAACAVQSAFGFRNTPAQLRDENMTTTTKTPPATPDAVTMERTRVSTILNLGNKHSIPDESLRRMIDAGTPLDDARSAILDYLASQGDAIRIGHNAPGSQTFDNPEFHTQAASDAIYARLSQGRSRR
jgi:ATP-dependent protease ClpP protease subunit